MTVFTFIDKWLDTIEKPVPFIEGIYFSHKSGKFFEVVRNENGTVRPKYVCGGYGPKVSEGVFRIQYEILELYELIIPYEEQKMSLGIVIIVILLIISIMLFFMGIKEKSGEWVLGSLITLLIAAAGVGIRSDVINDQESRLECIKSGKEVKEVLGTKVCVL